MIIEEHGPPRGAKPLPAGTTTGARSVRRRRVALAAVATAVAVAVASAVAVVTVPRLLPADGRTPGDAVPPGTQRAAALPAADAPGAAQRPDAVGTDPAVLHFDIDPAPFGGAGTDWWSTAGRERGEIWAGTPGSGGYYRHVASVLISRSLDLARGDRTGDVTAEGKPVRVTVGGRPGQIQKFTDSSRRETSTWELWWQPVDGLWAVLTMDALEAGAVVAAAAAARFDRSQRCAVPVRVTAPAGAAWHGCSTAMEPRDATGRSWRSGQLDFRSAAGGTLTFAYGFLSDDTALGRRFVPNRTVAGRPAMWEAGESARLVVPGDDGRNLFIGVRGPGFTEQDALTVAGSAVFSDDVIDLTTWPVRAVA